MERKSYFTLREWAIIVLMALSSALMNTYLPIKSITEHFTIPGPAAGMALFGGIIFVLWICIAYRIIRKKYAGIITSVLIACVCLFVRPWYGVVDPYWFSVYGVIGLLFMGVVVELVETRSSNWGIFGGGLGNLSCLVVTWLAIGFHTGVWIALEASPFLILGAVASGSIGALIGHWAIQMIKANESSQNSNSKL